MPHKWRAYRVSNTERLGCAFGENMGICYTSPGLVPGLLAASSVLMNEPRSAWRKGRPTLNSAVDSTAARLKPKGIYRPAPQDEESGELFLAGPAGSPVLEGDGWETFHSGRGASCQPGHCGGVKNTCCVVQVKGYVEEQPVRTHCIVVRFLFQILPRLMFKMYKKKVLHINAEMLCKATTSLLLRF